MNQILLEVLLPYVDVVARLIGYLVMVGAGAMAGAFAGLVLLKVSTLPFIWAWEGISDWLNDRPTLPADREFTDTILDGVQDTSRK